MTVFPVDYLDLVECPKEHAMISTFVLAISVILGWLAISDFTSPLRRYPGPFLAKWTNWWRFALVLTGSYHEHVKNLHKQYGPVVRIGPNLLDLDTPELVKTLYGSDESWRKTEFYKNSSMVVDGREIFHLFSEIDPASHARMKRRIAKFFGQGNVLSKEVLMDGVVKDLCSHLENRYQEKSCDLGEWIAFCAWDILSALTFSQPFGYLDKGCDFDNSLSISDTFLDYFSAVGQMPFLDYLLDKNPIIRIGPPTLGTIAGIAVENLAKRQNVKEPGCADMPDYLQHFIDIQNSDPDVTQTDVVVSLISTLVAGADTIAITIRTIFYYALRNPAVYRRLEEEILAAKLEEPAPYALARAQPYLEATVREAMRIHPGVCMMLERYVPESGLRLPDGTYVPPGTAVGINPYVLGRNKDVWGPDADEFRPERWLRAEGESEDAYRDRMRLFNAADLTFGDGARVCIGRYIAQMEVYKVVATLIGHFEIQLADPEREWDVVGSFFFRQKGLICNLKRRA
ncbi:cytochrome P450 [Xylariaceae sp. FL0662B]|nr:cytochrome P450 [Xylariaceae sp. FL0662B]